MAFLIVTHLLTFVVGVCVGILLLCLCAVAARRKDDHDDGSDSAWR